MFTIDFVARRDSDMPVKSVYYEQPTLSGACEFADRLQCLVGDGPAPIIGFLIRNRTGHVVHRSYRLFGPGR
jgi:hypothetical protein